MAASTWGNTRSARKARSRSNDLTISDARVAIQGSTVMSLTPTIVHCATLGDLIVVRVKVVANAALKVKSSHL